VPAGIHAHRLLKEKYESTGVIGILGGDCAARRQKGAEKPQTSSEFRVCKSDTIHTASTGLTFRKDEFIWFEFKDVGRYLNTLE
jgi:hypothetical protein